MAQESPPQVSSLRPIAGRRLESWKEIAAYLRRDVRTVQRWEKSEGLPVRRHVHQTLASVYANTTEIDSWWNDRRFALEGNKPSVPAGKPASRGHLRLFVWTTVAVALVAVALLPTLLGPDEDTGAPWKPVPLTSYPGMEILPTLSPDGSQVAFAWKSQAQDDFDIYIKSIGTEARRRFTDDPRVDFSPAWSPDGMWIAFVRRLSDGVAAVYLKSPAGGPERELARLSGPLYEVVRYLAWAPGGQWLIAGEPPSSERPGRLVTINVATREKRQLIQTPEGGLDLFPAVSPSGHKLAFGRFTSFNKAEIYTLDLTEDFHASGKPRRLSFVNQISDAPTWSGDGGEVIYPSGTANQIWLWRIAVDGSAEPKRVAFLGPQTMPTAPVMSRNGDRLVFVNTSGLRNLWELNLSHPSQPGSPPALLVQSTYLDYDPRYSPDGRRIAFISTRSGSSELWLCNRDGSDLIQLTHIGGTWTSCPSWSPDGNHIAFQSPEGGKTDVYVIPASGGAVTRLTEDPGNDESPSWSRDGRWVYFSSERTGEFQVWKQPWKRGEAVQITRSGGYAPQESHDGRFLYYAKRSLQLTAARTSIWRAEVGGGEESELIAAATGRFAVASGGVYFIPPSQSDSGGSEIRFLDFEVGEERRVVEFDQSIGYSEFDVAPDGSSLLYSQLDEIGSDLMMVEGFQ